MIESNPKYSETIILGKVQGMLGHIKQIIHSQDIQKENMKNAINEMIKIVREEYTLLEGPEQPSGLKEKTINEEKEDKKDKEDKEEKTFHSELLEKEINLDNKGTFIPIKN